MMGIVLMAGFAVCAVLFGYGLATGRMPTRGPSYSRTANPVWFWLQGALWGGAGLYCLVQLLLMRGP